MTGPDKPIPKLLTEGEAADILRTSTRTLRSLRSRGRIEYVRIGRKVAYTEQNCLDFIEQCTVREDPPRTTRNRTLARRPFDPPGRGIAAIIAERRKKR